MEVKHIGFPNEECGTSLWNFYMHFITLFSIDNNEVKKIEKNLKHKHHIWRQLNTDFQKAILNNRTFASGEIMRQLMRKFNSLVREFPH